MFGFLFFFFSFREANVAFQSLLRAHPSAIVGE